MSKVRLSVDYISVAEGRRQGSGQPRRSSGSAGARGQRSGIAVTERSGLLRFKPDKGKLVVLAQPDLPGGLDAAASIADWIAGEYVGDSSSSVVSCLTRALQTANRRLSKENLKSLSTERRNVAVACVVVRDQDLYLTQIGPILALRLRDDDLESIGEPVSSSTMSFVRTLGQDCEIETHLSHDSIRAGDVVVLLTPGLARMANGAELVRCLRAADSVKIVDNLFHLHQVSLDPEDFSAAVLVAMPAETRRATRKVAAPEPAVLDRSRVSRRDQAYNDDEGVPTQRSGRLSGSARLSGSGSVSPPLADVRKQRTEIRRPREEPQAVVDRAEAPGRQYDFKRIAIFALLPLVLVAAAFLGVQLFVRGQQEKAQQVEAVALLQKMAQSQQDAQEAQDVGLKRRLLSEAERLAAQGAAAKPNDQSLVSTRERIRKELDQLGVVVRLPAARKLVDLGQEAKEADPVKIIVQGVDLYILDRGTGRLYKYLLDASGEQVQPAANPVVVRRRDRIGEAAVGQITAMAWIPPGGARLQGALVFVDDGGGVYEYDPARGLALLRAASNPWPEAVKAIGGYAGSLYVLAPKQQQLIWYPPSPLGYDKPPYRYVNPEAQTDLSTAVDFVVDSSLFLLRSTGKIERFSAGRPQTFDSAMPDAPLKAPRAIFASLSARSVYVVDSGSQRIVQFSRDGHFERQFQYGGSDNLFQDLRGVSVDEQRKKIYFLADKRVFSADILE